MFGANQHKITRNLSFVEVCRLLRSQTHIEPTVGYRSQRSIHTTGQQRHFKLQENVTLAARALPSGTNRQIIAEDSNHRFASSANDALKGILRAWLTRGS